MPTNDDHQARANPLPPGVLHSLRATRRPAELKLLPLAGATLGAFIAMCLTIVAAGLNEKAVFYALFSVPFAMSVGLLWGANQADRMLGR